MSVKILSLSGRQNLVHVQTKIRIQSSANDAGILIYIDAHKCMVCIILSLVFRDYYIGTSV